MGDDLLPVLRERYPVLLGDPVLREIACLAVRLSGNPRDVLVCYIVRRPHLRDQPAVVGGWGTTEQKVHLSSVAAPQIRS